MRKFTFFDVTTLFQLNAYILYNYSNEQAERFIDMMNCVLNNIRGQYHLYGLYHVIKKDANRSALYHISMFKNRIQHHDKKASTFNLMHRFAVINSPNSSGLERGTCILMWHDRRPRIFLQRTVFR